MGMKFKKLKPTVKLALMIFTALEMSSVAMASLGGQSDITSMGSVMTSNSSAKKLAAGSVIALNHEINVNGRVLPAGSELIVDDEGFLSLVEVDEKGHAKEKVTELGIKIDNLTASEYAVLKQNEMTGEIEEYNIPSDFALAGPGKKRKKRSRVTNCYHVVKNLVRRRITLTGLAAYEAAPQLRAAGWQKYADYNFAPNGSVCVFAAGGLPTSSGGQIYGHVGVKGSRGIANPLSGFHLERPFLGCWSEQ